jgi:hypothetical protein
MHQVNSESVINSVINNTDESRVDNIIKYILSDETADKYLKDLANKKLDTILEKYDNSVQELGKIEDSLSELLMSILDEFEKSYK